MFSASLFCSTSSIMYGIGGGGLFTLVFSLYGATTTPTSDYFSFLNLLLALLTLLSYIFGIKNHLEEAYSEQKFINYDFIRIFFPFTLIGVKFGFAMNNIFNF